jgi:hypothetical protein
MFEKGQIVLVTGDWENNNTKGKIGIILNIDGSVCKIGFFDELKKTNGDTKVYQEKYDSIKSTWWVGEYALKKAMTKNKFK